MTYNNALLPSKKYQFTSKYHYRKALKVPRLTVELYRVSQSSYVSLIIKRMNLKGYNCISTLGARIVLFEIQVLLALLYFLQANF